MNIGVDFDDVLYPYHEHLKRRIQNRWGVDLSRQRITTFYYEDLPSLRAQGATREQVWEEVRATWKEVESHDAAPLLDAHAPGVLAGLARKHRITVISARTADARPHVDRFLARHGIRPHTILLGRYVKRGFDVLIDDFPKHALENVESGGYSILYTIDENSTFDESRYARIHRVHSWKEVGAAIDRIARRRPTLD